MWTLPLPLLTLCQILGHSSSQINTANTVDLDVPEFVDTWVIVRSSPCSATCGLGLRTQELCPLGATEANGMSCWVRRVKCLDSWQCGLQTQTSTAGQRLVLDCLEEVMGVMGRFAFMVSWRFARGIVTRDNSLFVRLDVPGLDRVILDPVREEDAGTYRCDVQDTSYRRVKRMYKGVKVLSPHVLSLDYTKGLLQWEEPGGTNTTLVTRQLYPGNTVRKMVLISLASSAAIAAVLILGLWTFSYHRKSTRSPTSRLGNL